MSDARAEVETDGPVAVVTLANPGRANAMDDALRVSLLGALRAVTSDDDVRVVVLTGAGGTFCAGGDLGSMPTTDQDAMHARLGQMHDIARLLLSGSRPVVTAVEGAAFGSGAALALAADIAVVASDARIGFSFPRVGLAPDTGLAWTLSRRVGPARARRLVLDAAVVDGPRAVADGIADELAEPGQALTTALGHARRLAAGAPLALAATRRLFDTALRPVEDVLAAELEIVPGLWRSADFAEGRQAFFDKRPADFTGR